MSRQNKIVSVMILQNYVMTGSFTILHNPFGSKADLARVKHAALQEFETELARLKAEHHEKLQTKFQELEAELPRLREQADAGLRRRVRIWKFLQIEF